jgi:hypothetical protein
VPLTLTITQTEDGRLTVNGPIANKVLCYGLLSAAQDAIRDYHLQPREEPTRIITPIAAVPDVPPDLKEIS